MMSSGASRHHAPAEACQRLHWGNPLDAWSISTMRPPQRSHCSLTTSRFSGVQLFTAGFKVWGIDLKFWGTDMRLFIACAIIISAAIGMGGCWWHHHAAAVVTQPLK